MAHNVIQTQDRRVPIPGDRTYLAWPVQPSAAHDIQQIALRKLRMLNNARALADLAVPPNNRLEALKGDRTGQHSIRVNQQWRICFVWTAGGPDHVEIVDYH